MPSADEAIRWVHLLKGHAGYFKVGLELFVAAGPEVLAIIRAQGDAGIFLDLKFHDIPETVRRAAYAASRHGARFFTVHTDGGRCPLKTVVEGMEGSGTKVLAITTLTSINQSDLKELGYREGLSIRELVLSRAQLARDAGCDGIVCSGQETKAIRATLGPDFIIVNPGIRPDWSGIPGDDQKRIVTPSQAIKNGADYIVVGRPIRTAPDPVEAADRIIQEIAQAMG